MREKNRKTSDEKSLAILRRRVNLYARLFLVRVDALLNFGHPLPMLDDDLHDGQEYAHNDGGDRNEKDQNVGRKQPRDDVRRLVIRDGFTKKIVNPKNVPI